MKTIFLTAFFNAIVAFAFAQNEKMETDRPGQTFTAFTTPQKWVQSEIHFSKQTNREIQQYLFQYPALLVKYGIERNLEGRLFTAYGSRVSESVNNGRTSDHGVSELEVGVKWKFANQRSLLPHTALVVHYMFNTLRTSQRDTVNGMHARLAMQHSISPSFSVNYNLGVNWPNFQRPHSYLYSFSPRFYFEQKWMLYIEAFGDIWKGKKPRHGLDGGIAYYISDRLRADASYGRKFGLNHPVHFLSVGASYRF